MMTQLVLCAAALLAADSQDKTTESKPGEVQQITVDTPELAQIERNIVELTNKEREKRGLRSLKIDFKLVRSARVHCSWMARARRMQHSSANVAENIAMGQRSSSQALRAWMNSQGHRANILNPRYSRIGVAAYQSPNGTIYWCQQFLY